MDYQDIDVLKSVNKERLIFNRVTLFDKIIDLSEWCLWITFPAFFLFMSILVIWDQIVHEKSKYLLIAILVFFVVLMLSGLFLYFVLKIKNLRRINGTSTELNKNIIKEIALEFGWIFHKDNEIITVLSPPWKWLSNNWGRQIVIIYDKQDILVNCMTFGVYQLKSPMYWYGNRKFENIVRDQFKIKTKGIT